LYCDRAISFATENDQRRKCVDETYDERQGREIIDVRRAAPCVVDSVRWGRIAVLRSPRSRSELGGVEPGHLLGLME
jgi:hypothetical protein